MVNRYPADLTVVIGHVAIGPFHRAGLDWQHRRMLYLG